MHQLCPLLSNRAWMMLPVSFSNFGVLKCELLTKHAPAGPIVDRVRALGRSFGHSTQRRDRFQAVVDCAQPSAKAKMPIQDVPTRWNATVHMLERAFQLRPSIDLYVRTEPGSVKYQLGDADWSLLAEVVELLSPLEQVSTAKVVFL